VRSQDENCPHYPECCDAQPESAAGQFPPPSFVAGMEELASIADTGVAKFVDLHQVAAVIGGRPRHAGDGCSPETCRHGR
jgi:hypothetical protein